MFRLNFASGRAMRQLFHFCIFLLISVAPLRAASTYEAPQGCKPIATLRMENCLVRQVARCEAGNIVDSFHEGTYVGRSYYTHPSLFLRFEGVDGRISGHEYGAGTPRPDARLSPGDIYTYSRDVYRSAGEPEHGDVGTEEMEIREPVTLTIGGKRYRLLDIRFEVTNDEGYHYRERAFLLQDPGLTIGVVSATYGEDGEIAEQYSSIPESLSLFGDPGFRSFDPAASCLPST